MYYSSIWNNKGEKTSKESIDLGLKRLKIDIEYDYKEFEKFYEILIEGNKRTDLTTIVEKEEVDIKHFLDSMTAFMIPEFREDKRLIDLGTGAGFPAIPLKIVNPQLDITLLDGLNKRLIFLEEVIEKMNFNKIRTFHSRGEDAGKDKKYREKYDIAVSRAVSRLNKLVELTLPLVKPGGIFLAMKGPDMGEELDEARNAITLLGGRVRDVIEFELTEGDNGRTLVVIEKIKSTPAKYPRNYGQIKNKPL